MIPMIVFILSVVGFALIAAGMRRYQTLLPMFKPYRGPFQIIGWICLGASLILCASRPHTSVALVEWFGLLTVAALPTVAALTIYTDTKNKNAR